MHVRVEDQQEDARVVTDPDGEVALIMKPGLVSPRAFVGLVIALEPVLQQTSQYLQSTG